MRIISYNVNGIRSALKKGFLDWLDSNPADVICLQEIKALASDFDLDVFEERGYHNYWFSAQKKGYSGVGILSRIKPDLVESGSGMKQSDEEGRIIRADFKDISLINAYFPSGTSGSHRQDYKYVWLEEFTDYLKALQKKRKKLIICGDYNIAHREIDIHNPVANKNTTGFLPEERAWMDRFFESGFIDSFRHINSDPHHYSWWSMRNPAIRQENKGWRIDYISITENLLSGLHHSTLLPAIKHSDHCPVYTELKNV